ncbi:hypothetical protein NQZ68_035226 [Dissostichus eleginoides]|nr:hypothetical protein NQZ68_035226 [Dissostichus eleginoides]
MMCAASPGGGDCGDYFRMEMRYPIALCHPISLESHHGVPQMVGPDALGGIALLKSN